MHGRDSGAHKCIFFYNYHLLSARSLHSSALGRREPSFGMGVLGVLFWGLLEPSGGEVWPMR